MDCVHIFNEHGDYLIKFDLHGSYDFRTVAFHRVSQKVVAAGITHEGAFFHMKKSSTQYTKHGEFSCRTLIQEKKILWLERIAVTTEGRISVIPRFKDGTIKVIIA